MPTDTKCNPATSKSGLIGPTFMSLMRSQTTLPPVVEKSLRDRVTEWQVGATMPRYHMSDLCRIFDTHPKVLGGVLYGLSWTRKRSYRANSPSCRYWVPPKGGL